MFFFCQKHTLFYYCHTWVRVVVDVHEVLVVPVYSPCHSRPWLGNAEVPLHITLCNYLVLQCSNMESQWNRLQWVKRLTFSVLSSGRMPKKGREGKPGLGGLLSGAGLGAMVIPPVSVQHTPHNYTVSLDSSLHTHRKYIHILLVYEPTSLPVGVDNGALLVPHHTIVPLPRLFIEGLPH